MEFKKYTADISFNDQPLRSQSSDDLNQLTAKVICYIESIHPNAIGKIRENSSGRIIQTHRKTSFD